MQKKGIQFETFREALYFSKKSTAFLKEVLAKNSKIYIRLF